MIDPFTKTRFDPHLRLETWYPEGVLDHPMATQMANHLGFTERTMDEPFNRFTDLSKVTSIRLDFADISSIAAERREAYKERPPVKSAFLAISPAAYGVARMFAALMEPSPIEVEVFRDPEAAASWLGVPAQALEA
jgi:hypothetical protein